MPKYVQILGKVSAHSGTSKYISLRGTQSDEREKRKYSVKVYFDQGNYTKLLRRSKNRQCSLSSLVYELAVNGYVREAMSKEDAANLRSLSGMANNLNQLAHEAHVHHFSFVEKRVLDLAGRIDEVLVRLGSP